MRVTAALYDEAAKDCDRLAHDSLKHLARRETGFENIETFGGSFIDLDGIIKFYDD